MQPLPLFLLLLLFHHHPVHSRNLPPVRPQTLHQAVHEHLVSGGQSHLRKTLNLLPGVYYDPLRFYTREDILHRNQHDHPPASSTPYSSDLSLLRALNLHVPGVDPPPTSSKLLTLQSANYICRVSDERNIYGNGCLIKVSYSPSTPESIIGPVEFSIKQWANEFRSAVPIRLCFVWGGSMEDLTLGATTTPFFTDGSLFDSLNDKALYSPALASALEGRDVIPEDKFHVHMVLNDKIDWHLDTGSRAPFKKYDLSTTVLHELTHGLFFSGTIKATKETRTAEFTDQRPGRFDQFMNVQGNVGVATNCRDTSNLFNAITNPSLRFVDSQSGASFGLYSPPLFVPGSSTYHFDNETMNADCSGNGISRDKCSDLMTHQLEDGYTQRAIGETTLRILRAMNSSAEGVKGVEDCELPESPINQESVAQGAEGRGEDFKLPTWGIATVAGVAGVGSILVFGVVITTVVSRREGR